MALTRQQMIASTIDGYFEMLNAHDLDGVMRGRVLAAAAAAGIETAEVAAGPERLREASGLFLTNSLIGLRAAARLDGLAVAPHPGVERLAARA